MFTDFHKNPWRKAKKFQGETVSGKRRKEKNITIE
jgi:hypothetical protein